MNASLAVTENALQFRWLEAPPAGASREGAPGVIWLRMPLPFALDHINLWLLADGDERAGYGVAAISALFRAHGLAAEHVAALAARGNAYRRGVPELPLYFERLAAGDEIAIGPQRWRVIPGYGHSPEHASLYCAELGVLISGDMLLPRISTNVSVWPVEPDGDPLGRFLASLDRLAE